MAAKKTVPAKKTTAKKTVAPAKKTTRKVLPGGKSLPASGVEFRKTVAKKSASASKKPQHKMVAKVMCPIISVGTEDRKRSLEQFMKDIERACRKAGVKNFTIGSHYYIVDGKAYAGEDFDVKTQQLKKDAKPKFTGERDDHGSIVKSKDTTSHSMSGDDRLSAREYDKKYGPGGNPQVAETIAQQKARRREYLEEQERLGSTPSGKIKKGKSAKPQVEEEWVEEEWDEEDVDDTEMHEEVVKDRTRAAVKKLKSSPKVKIKKSASAKPQQKKKVVKRRK